MSRSYKKHPIYTDRDKAGAAKFWKRRANRVIRHYNQRDRVQHNKYKRLFNSWEIHDWISRWSRREAIESYNSFFWDNREKDWVQRWDYDSEEEFLNRHWAKYYRRK